MICYSAGRLDTPDTGGLKNANHLFDELRLHFPKPCRAPDICSIPKGQHGLPELSYI